MDLLENVATRWQRSTLASHHADGDLGAHKAMFAPSATFSNGGRAAVLVEDRESLIARLYEPFPGAAGATSRLTVDPVAVRGEGLAVSRLAIEPSRPMGVAHLLSEMDEAGLCREVVAYPDAQLEEAMSQLDARFAANLAADERSTLAFVTEYSRAYLANDAMTVRSMTAPGFVSDDRRPIGFGRMDIEGTLVRRGSLDGVSDRRQTVTTSIARITPEGVVLTWRASELGGASWHYAILLLVRDGLLVYEEYYEAEQLDTAVARFDYLTGTLRR